MHFSTTSFCLQQQTRHIALYAPETRETTTTVDKAVQENKKKLIYYCHLCLSYKNVDFIRSQDDVQQYWICIFSYEPNLCYALSPGVWNLVFLRRAAANILAFGQPDLLQPRPTHPSPQPSRLYLEDQSEWSNFVIMHPSVEKGTISIAFVNLSCT